MDYITSVLVGTSPYNAEIRSFFQGFAGATAVKNGANKDRQMNWWHALCLSAVTAYGGGLFNPIWIGKPAAMIAGGDVAIPITIVAFILANYTPIGYSLPVKVVTTIWSQLFKSLGTMAFINQALQVVPASKFYPIPILGPVLYGALLGNMGSFFINGFHGHLQKGMPFPFQNGIVCGLFFHLYANDHEGPLGDFVRAPFSSVQPESMDDTTFAKLMVSGFMVLTALLQFPQLLGSSFNPFVTPYEALAASFVPSPTKQSAGALGSAVDSDDGENLDGYNTQQTPSKKKRQKKKKKA
eukprot:CAMPEP_0113501210 /NCGR_PEP_ID=MMETSP0014_2-20120614/32822_1 /TAXON_ID=2857 /ORGANISM="Nitzschia sp." /LENGTH=296 /DNA_ID=CAMNT_0000395761 /DNA_START=87 /DNA_END=977 /DNA_ORIENTATION=- /assembly_acc=CAM_ASM_000159